MENKNIAIIAIVAVIVIGVGLWATGSVGTTDNSLSGQEIHLAAAASLKNAYDNDLIPMFEKKYPGVKVVPTYASSGDLQTQIENGNDVDVFMSAATKQMNALINESLIDNGTNSEFLENKVVLIVPKDSKNNISSFEDLKNVNGTIAIGDPKSVPAGQYAQEVLNNSGIWKDVEPKVSQGKDVTEVLNQVAQGSAECGIVYATDAKSNEDVKVVCEASDDVLKTPVIYPVAITTNAKNPDGAKKFLDFLQTQEAKDIFVKYGFTLHE